MTGPEIALLLALIGAVSGWVVAEISNWKLRRENLDLKSFNSNCEAEIRTLEQIEKNLRADLDKAEFKLRSIHGVVLGYMEDQEGVF